jgi:hypothetical protein
VGLKTRDYDLVDALDHEENVLLRPCGDDYPSFTCVSIFSRFYQPISLICDLKIDDYQNLSYLSTVNPGFLPVLSATGVHIECRDSLGLTKVCLLAHMRLRPVLLI